MPSEAILDAAGLRPDEADVLIGGPPCQPFSKSGYWARGDAGRLDDPRADTLTAYLRVLRDTRPRAFLLENVAGLAYRGKDEGLRTLLDGVERVNEEAGTRYTVAHAKLNAADYGVPQLRERVFLIGSRDGRAFRFPEPTHGRAEEIDLLRGREPWRTAWDALGDLPERPNEAGLEMGGQVGRAPPIHPRGPELPLAHAARGRAAPVRLADALLELPPQARQGTPILDDSSPARLGDRTVPLDEPQAVGARDVPPTDDAR